MSTDAQHAQLMHRLAQHVGECDISAIAEDLAEATSTRRSAALTLHAVAASAGSLAALVATNGSGRQVMGVPVLGDTDESSPEVAAARLLAAGISGDHPMIVAHVRVIVDDPDVYSEVMAILVRAWCDVVPKWRAMLAALPAGDES